MQSKRTNRFQDKFQEMVQNICQPFEQQIARCLSQPHLGSCIPEKEALTTCLNNKRNQLIRQKRDGRLNRLLSQPKAAKKEQCGGLGPCLLKKNGDESNEDQQEGKPFTFKAYGMRKNWEEA